MSLDEQFTPLPVRGARAIRVVGVGTRLALYAGGYRIAETAVSSKQSAAPLISFGESHSGTAWFLPPLHVNEKVPNSAVILGVYAACWYLSHRIARAEQQLGNTVYAKAAVVAVTSKRN